MRNSLLTAPLFGAMYLTGLLGCAQPGKNLQTGTKYKFESKPAWQDEFDYSGKPNPEKWGYDLGDHGWGNHELENYTNALKNARVENGNLVIEAINEPSGKQSYSSARLVTKGKGDFL